MWKLDSPATTRRRNQLHTFLRQVWLLSADAGRGHDRCDLARLRFTCSTCETISLACAYGPQYVLQSFIIRATPRPPQRAGQHTHCSSLATKNRHQYWNSSSSALIKLCRGAIRKETTTPSDSANCRCHCVYWCLLPCHQPPGVRKVSLSLCPPSHIPSLATSLVRRRRCPFAHRRAAQTETPSRALSLSAAPERHCRAQHHISSAHFSSSLLHFFTLLHFFLTNTHQWPHSL